MGGIFSAPSAPAPPPPPPPPPEKSAEEVHRTPVAPLNRMARINVVALPLVPRAAQSTILNKAVLIRLATGGKVGARIDRRQENAAR
jgi:hypothetical protein